MKLLELEKKLIAAAKGETPGDGVPYAFEKRVMAHIRAHPVSAGALWAEALWRSAGACLAIVAIMAAVAAFAPKPAAVSTATPDLSLEFEKTMLAALETADR